MVLRLRNNALALAKVQLAMVALVKAEPPEHPPQLMAARMRTRPEIAGIVPRARAERKFGCTLDDGRQPRMPSGSRRSETTKTIAS